jgi:hypothetical protein
MILSDFASGVIIISLLISLGAYVWLSRREGTFVNILTPMFIIGVPAFYLLPLVYINVRDSGFSNYAYIYVYGTLAVESWTFVLAYILARRTVAPVRGYGYRNFTVISLMCLVFGCAIYVPVLLEFPEYLLDPREIYKLTRTGFGHETYVSCILAYLAIIFILFARRSWLTKTFVVVVASALLLLHGSKGQVLTAVLLLLLFQVYVRKRQITLLPALACCVVIAAIVVALFAMTMTLGETPAEAVEAIGEYSDTTRNAMLVIDSHLPLQYGRLTLEANVYGRIPRVLMPSKPKNFGMFYLAEEFYPEWFDSDTGSPDFGIGMQYADFGVLALVYLGLFSILRGWLAGIFVNRLKFTNHPADFFLVAFLAEISILPLGGAGWLLPEAILAAMLIRFVSRIGQPAVSAPGFMALGTSRVFSALPKNS